MIGIMKLDRIGCGLHWGRLKEWIVVQIIKPFDSCGVFFVFVNCWKTFTPIHAPLTTEFIRHPSAHLFLPVVAVVCLKICDNEVWATWGPFGGHEAWLPFDHQGGWALRTMFIVKDLVQNIFDDVPAYICHAFEMLCTSTWTKTMLLQSPRITCLSTLITLLEVNRILCPCMMLA